MVDGFAKQKFEATEELAGFEGRTRIGVVWRWRQWNFMTSWGTWKCGGDSLRDQSLLPTKTVQSLQFIAQLWERPHLERRWLYAQVSLCRGSSAEHVNKEPARGRLHSVEKHGAFLLRTEKGPPGDPCLFVSMAH